MSVRRTRAVLASRVDPNLKYDLIIFIFFSMCVLAHRPLRLMAAIFSILSRLKYIALHSVDVYFLTALYIESHYSITTLDATAFVFFTHRNVVA